jgi:hypothetical protein
MSWPLEIRDRLVAQGVGVFGTNIFIGSGANIPDGAGPYLLIRETGGSEGNKTQDDNGTEIVTAYIGARATNPTQARVMAVNAYNALGGRNGLYNITLTGVFYIHLKTRQPVTDTGMDATGSRTMYSFNVEAEKYPS